MMTACHHRCLRMFSLTMLGSTPHGDAYTLAEYGSMCRNAGFEAPRLIPLEPDAAVTAGGQKAGRAGPSLGDDRVLARPIMRSKQFGRG